MAARLRVHPNTVTRWEARRRLPGPTHICELAAVLDLDVGTVAAFFDEMRTPSKKVGLPGRHLRSLRRRLQVPAEDLARTCDVHISTIYNWERSRARVPDRAAPALAGRLGVTESWLRTYLAGPGMRSIPVVERNHPLRRRRKRARLTQEMLARKLGMSREQISKWECGQAPPIFAVRRLAGFYGVPVSVMARECGSEITGSLDPEDWSDLPVGETLRALRAWCGISQRELARLVDREPVTVRFWEAGRSSPPVPMRRRLEQLFNVPPGSLVAAGTGANVAADDQAVS